MQKMQKGGKKLCHVIRNDDMLKETEEFYIARQIRETNPDPANGNADSLFLRNIFEFSEHFEIFFP